MKFRMGPTFPGTWGMEWRAHQVLKRRSPEAILQGQKVVRSWIEEWAEQRLAEEIDEYVRRRTSELSQGGGWELEYLPSELIDHERGISYATASDIAYLLENWPDSNNLPTDYPTEHASDLDTLGEILTSGYPYDDIEGFEGATEAEIYAAVALETIDVIHRRLTPDGQDRVAPTNTWGAEKILKASYLALEAMELICVAERHLSDQQLDKMRAELRNKEELETRKRIRSEMAKAAADAKLAADPKQMAKMQVKEMWARWQQEPTRYRGKAAFARDMLDKFDVLQSQRVIEGWCLEWQSESTQQGT